jgi:hypothetical protein
MRIANALPQDAGGDQEHADEHDQVGTEPVSPEDECGEFRERVVGHVAEHAEGQYVEPEAEEHWHALILPLS